MKWKEINISRTLSISIAEDGELVSGRNTHSRLAKCGKKIAGKAVGGHESVGDAFSLHSTADLSLD